MGLFHLGVLFLCLLRRDSFVVGATLPERNAAKSIGVYSIATLDIVRANSATDIQTKDHDMWIFGKKDSEYYFKEGEKLSRSHDSVNIVMFNKAIELSPRDAALYFRVGSSLFRHCGSREDTLKMALCYLNTATELDAGNSMAHLVRGNILIKLGETNDAIAAFGESIRINPQNAAAYNVRGKALAQMEQYLTAMDDLTRAVLLAGDSAYGALFQADLDEFVKARKAPVPLAARHHTVNSRGGCPRCYKTFEKNDLEIPNSALRDGVFQGRLVTEVMECNKHCGAMYCWPACCKMEPCKCGSHEGFVSAVVFVCPD